MRKSILAMGGAVMAMTGASGTMAQVPGPDEDPFIWLEDARSERALDWVRAENEKTEAVLKTDPRFETLKAEALAIYDADDRIPSVSYRHDGLYNFWQDDEHVKGIVRRTSLDSYRTENPDWETVLDVDALAAADGMDWVYKGSTCLPPEDRYCLISLSDGGKDAITVREYDMVEKRFVENGFTFDEGIQWMSWIDRDTLIVARDWGEGTLTESKYPFVSKIVRRGQSLDQAEEIFRGDASDVLASVGVLRDAAGNFHGLLANRGLDFWHRSKYLRVGDEWVELDVPKKSSIGNIVDGRVLLTLEEPWSHRGTQYATDSMLSYDLAEWKADPNGAVPDLVITPQERQTLQGMGTTSDAIYLGMLDNVRGKVVRLDYQDGEWQRRTLNLPQNATISVAAAADASDEAMFSVSDFLSPTSLYYYREGGGDPALLKTTAERFDATGVTVEQHEATSKDGTKIPYFLVKPAGMKMDGSTPTLMYGYGGFQNAMLPSYLGTTGKLWVERGGAYVLGNMRGGGEFGPDWHQSAIRENKQRTWDDFIAIAEDLIARGVTSPDRLGVMGGSQGGLLVGTAFTQRPELFDAAVVQVPLFDMLRITEIGRGASWVGEYGDPRIPEQRKWLEGYSPYQMLTPDRTFPKVLFTTSTADDRTHPAHGRKAAARMAANGQPYLYFEDMTGGHSAGNDNEQRAERRALELVYLMQQLMDD